MQIKKIIVSLAVLAALPCAAAGKHHTPRKVATTKTPADYVNPFVGTDGFGNVYPGAQLPFGGIQISPDTDTTMTVPPATNGTALPSRASR